MFHYFKKNIRGLAPTCPESCRGSKVEGFSLIELLISIGIMVALLAVVVTNQSTYIENVSVGNLAEELSLTFSQAQAYGIAVRELVPGSANFSAPYGLALSLLSSGSNASYLFFADRNSNRIYDGDWTCQTGGSNECLEKTDISHGNFIDSLCVVRLSGASDLCTVGRVDVTFARPDTNAQLAFFDTSGVQMSPASVKGARVVLKSPNGITRSVLVYSTGQISLEGNYEYQYPTPYLTPYTYEYQYQTPYGYQYEYQYQYQTPYSYQYQYQYQYPYPTPPPTPTITYNGPASGIYVVGSGALTLTTPGTYTITINTSASITVKGVAGGAGGERGGSDSNGAAGGGGGGGGAVNSSGLSVALSSGVTYTAIVGSGGSFGSPGQPGGTTKFQISGSTVYIQLNGGSGGIDGNGGAGGSAAVGGGQNGGSGGNGNRGDRGSNGSSGPTGGGAGGGGKQGGDTSPAYVGGAGGSGSDQAGGAGGSAGGHACYDDGCDSWGGGSGTSASGSGGAGAGSEGGGGGGGGGGKLLGGGYYGGGGGGGGGTVWPPGAGGSGAPGVFVIQ